MNTKETKSLKRLYTDVSIPTHSQVKSMCALKNVPMRMYIAQAILEKLTRDTQWLKKS